MERKFFTPLSARETLERLRPRAEAMRELFRSMQRRQRKKLSSDEPVEPRYFSMLARFYEAVRALEKAGALVKDPGLGLLDFPARRAGKIVFLCWKVGEKSLKYWHETDAGFAGRRPVDEEGPWEEADGPLERTG